MVTILELSFGRAFFICKTPMRAILTFLLALLITNSAFTQVDTVIRYLDAEMNETPKPSVFTVMTLRTKDPQGNHLIQDFNMETGKKLRHFYTSAQDSTLLTGPYVEFYKDGKPRKKRNYNNGRPIGIWMQWYNNGQVQDSCFYNDQQQLEGIAKSWFADGKLNDSAWYPSDSMGRGYLYHYSNTGRIIGKGPMRNNLKHGVWTYYYTSGVRSLEEYYENNKCLSMICYDKNGRRATGDCLPDRDARYGNGISDWSNYISGEVSRGAGRLYLDQAGGDVVVTFAIDTTGEVTDIKIEKGSNTQLDNYAYQIIKRSLKWQPAKSHNQFIKVYRRQRISFKTMRK